MGVCVEWIFLLRLCCRSLRNHHVYISYSINGVSACARLSEADWKVKYVRVCVDICVCVYVLSEAECLSRLSIA